ncbi:TPA: hypothetical protein DCX15_05270 [bacterium]|nr:hypothetical protein [bacterium]
MELKEISFYKSSSRILEDIFDEVYKGSYLWSHQTTGKPKRYQLQDKAFVADEAMMIERLGYKVRIIRDSEDNIKITTSQDLVLAEAILTKRCYTDSIDKTDAQALIIL